MKKIDSWLKNEFYISNVNLSVCRVFYSLTVLFYVVPTYIKHSHWLSNLPDALYYPPPGPMMLLSGFFPDYVIYSLISLITALSVLLLLGKYTRSVSIMLGISILLFDGNLYSIGKIDHGRILLAWFPIIMSWSSWGSNLAVDKNTKSEHIYWPYQLFALLVAFGLFTAGLPKLLGGWLSFDTQASFSKFHTSYYALNRQDLLASSLISTGNLKYFWEFQDWFTVGFEVLFLASIVKEKIFKLFICLAVGFHWGVALTMNIVFPEQIIIYFMFVDWSTLARHRVKFLLITTLLFSTHLLQISFHGIDLFVWLLYIVSILVALKILKSILPTSFVQS